MTDQHRFPVRVYYEDTDFSGNVYHAAYLQFMERARTEWLRARDVHHNKLIKDGLAFAVRHMEIDFLAPAKIDDELVVSTQISKLTGARIGLAQVILRGEQVLIEAQVTIVLIKEGGRAARLPRQIVGQIMPDRLES